MSTPRIVPAFDEVEDGEARVGLRAEAVAIEQLALERREEALAERVVVGIASSPTSKSSSTIIAPRRPNRRRHPARLEWLPAHRGVPVWGGV
jgi:hypothetical protein